MSKGKRREREAAELYEEAGFETFRPQESKYGETDMFSLFDMLAVRDDTTPRLVQVSTNANGRKDWMEESRRFWGYHTIPEYLQVYKREGWRLMRPVQYNDEWVTAYDERDVDCRIGEGLVEYLRGVR